VLDQNPDGSYFKLRDLPVVLVNDAPFGQFDEERLPKELKMMAKMGWNGGGLGYTFQGKAQPLPVEKVKEGRARLGYINLMVELNKLGLKEAEEGDEDEED
jgi:hypothetical protein